MKYRLMIVLPFLALFMFLATGYCEVYQADDIPWSGYWWPFTEGGLATGDGYKLHPSPLEKYDLVTTGSKYGPARSYGMKYYYDPSAVSWAGMCFYWSAASIMEPEPVHRGIYKGVLFNVGDKKGLLTAMYDTTNYESYATTKPEDFHQVLADFIGDQKKSIFFDIGTDGEHWNYPVFKYETNYITDGNRRHYTTTIYYASDAVRPDYVGTLVQHTTYYYYFDLDGDKIVDSGWEGDSIGREPLKAYEPFGPAPRNKNFSVSEVRKIVSADDDGYENNDRLADAAPLSTGEYDLLAIDDDFFALDMSAGGSVKIDVSSSFADELHFQWYSPDFVLLNEVDPSTEFEFTAYRSGTYYLAVSPNFPEEEIEYNLHIDMTLAYQAYFPVDPGGLWSNGVSVTCPDGADSRIILSGIQPDGTALQSYTEVLPNNSSLLGILDDFDFTETGNGYLRVDADTYPIGLQIPTDGDMLMLGANLMNARDASSTLYYPHLAVHHGWQTYYGLINIGDESESVTREGFDKTGTLVDSDTVELAPGEKIETDARYIRAMGNSAVCMRASTDSADETLLGYIEFLNPSFASKGRALVPLTGKDDTTLIIPHVLSGQDWWTGIAVMNTGVGNNDIICTAYDADGGVADTHRYELPEDGNLMAEAGDLFNNVASEEIASIRIASSSDIPLSGFVLFGNKNKKQLAGMPIRAANASQIYLPHVAESNRWWTDMSLVNPGNNEDSVSMVAYDIDGKLIAQQQAFLKPNQCLAGSVADIFKQPADIIRNMKYIKVSTGSGLPVSALYLIGSTDGNRLMGDFFVSGE